jgi:transposase
VRLRLGIDVACRTAHQASLADHSGRLLWAGRRFHTISADLERLWAHLPEGTDPTAVTVVLEPTRNAWVPLAAWFRRRGATVILVPPERAADLRAYYHKHTKTDRLDATLLARLPLLHPDGLHPERGLGPGDPLRRATRLRATLVKRRTTTLARLDALLELLGPGWLTALGADLANKTPLRFLAAGYAGPHTLKRLGQARLARFCYRHSRGAWGDAHAQALLAAAAQTLALWDGELDYAELADDIAVEARLALHLTEEVKELDERIGVLLAKLDPHGIITSAPGVAQITGAQILGRLGDPARFGSLAGVRAFSGLVPSLTASGSAASTAGRPKPATRPCGRHCSRPPTMPAAWTQPWPPATTGSWSTLASTTTRPCATSPPPCSPGSWPAGAAANATSSGMLTAARSPSSRHGASSPTATASHPNSAGRPEPSTAPCTQDEPAKQGVAMRSVDRPVHRPRYDIHPALTPVRNSTAPATAATAGGNC